MGRVVLACKSDEEERRAARAAAFPHSLLTDRTEATETVDEEEPTLRDIMSRKGNFIHLIDA